MSRTLENAPSLDSTIGAELVGLGLALASYGITSAQVVVYFGSYARRPFSLGVYFVIVLWCFDTLQMAVTAFQVADYVVLRHGDPMGLLLPPWAFGAIVIITEVNTMLIRFGYAYRIWKLSGRKRLIPCTIIASSLLVIAIGLVFAGAEFHFTTWGSGDHLRWTLYTAYSCQIAVDGVIVVAMLFILRRFRTGLQRLDCIIGVLTMYVVNTGFLRILVEILSIIFFITSPASFVFVGLYFLLSKLYTCSFFGVLNTEQLLVRQVAGDLPTGSTTLPQVFTSAVCIGPEGYAAPPQDDCSP
ncbi:hypothetical protein BD413DRAFT_256855 [Trametes elegans]|nr:hypothetical protein BD413DRAFT_256855 [Trametes elegans]